MKTLILRIGFVLLVSGAAGGVSVGGRQAAAIEQIHLIQNATVTETRISGGLQGGIASRGIVTDPPQAPRDEVESAFVSSATSTAPANDSYQPESQNGSVLLR
jgi:hypothetical protein